ncbi:hypothetical protein J6590_081546 [Homalodisca vitripennis]|nr:hypothetical protein J6590_081546 [Homalodisca vitripennis]
MMPFEQLLSGRVVTYDLVCLRPDLMVFDRDRKLLNSLMSPCRMRSVGSPLPKPGEVGIYAACDPFALTLRGSGFQVTVDALIVDSLGAWDNSNREILSRLGFSWQYGVALSRKCVFPNIH